MSNTSTELCLIANTRHMIAQMKLVKDFIDNRSIIELVDQSIKQSEEVLKMIESKGDKVHA